VHFIQNRQPAVIRLQIARTTVPWFGERLLERHPDDVAAPVAAVRRHACAASS
jgi:hypothetical protein